MLPPFKLGLGGPLGSGAQYMSWVTLTDLVRVIEASIRQDKLSGVYNVTAPNPATNAEFAAALGRALRRPALIPVPEAVLEFIMGEFAREALLCSQRVVPQRLLDAGFRFKHETIDEGVKAALEM